MMTFVVTLPCTKGLIGRLPTSDLEYPGEILTLNLCLHPAKTKAIIVSEIPKITQ